MKIVAISIGIAIAAALAFGLSDDSGLTVPNDPLPKTRTTSILLIKRPSSHSKPSDIHRPRLRMILIIRRRISLGNSSWPHNGIGAAKYDPFSHRQSLWSGESGDRLLSHNVHPSPRHSTHHKADGFSDHYHVKKEPELKYVRSGNRYSDDSDIDRYEFFKHQSQAPTHQDSKPRILRRETIVISLFVIATLCGLGLTILSMRPRQRVDDETNEEVDDKTYAPLLSPSVVTTTA